MFGVLLLTSAPAATSAAPDALSCTTRALETEDNGAPAVAAGLE